MGEDDAPSFSALAVLGISSICNTKKLAESKVDDAIVGFLVEPERMTIFVKPAYGCSAQGWSFEIKCSDVPRILDPAGPMLRVKG